MIVRAGVLAILVLGGMARGADGDAERIAKAIDELGQPSYSAARVELAKMDSKVVTAALLETLKKNLAAGLGMEGMIYHAAPLPDGQGNPVRKWIELKPQNVMIAHELADRKSAESVVLIEAVLEALTKENRTYSREMAACVYAMSGKICKYWNWDLKTPADFVPSESEKAWREKIAGKKPK